MANKKLFDSSLQDVVYSIDVGAGLKNSSNRALYPAAACGCVDLYGDSILGIVARRGDGFISIGSKFFFHRGIDH